MGHDKVLGKGEYLGDLNKIVNCSGISASTVSATSRVPGNEIVHRHENPILSLILDGYSIERVGKTVAPRVPGDLKFYGAGEFHQVKIDKFPSRNINIELEDCFLKETCISEGELAAAVNGPITKLLFLRSFHELLISDQFSDISIRMSFLGMIAVKKHRKNDRRTPSWVLKIKNILNDRWSENISLEDIAGEIGVHPVTVSKYFSLHFSCTLGSYIRQVRVQKSLALIKLSNLSLTEIAHQCGFADQSHFSRTFRLYTGMQPKMFRKI